MHSQTEVQFSEKEIFKARAELFDGLNKYVKFQMENNLMGTDKLSNIDISTIILKYFEQEYLPKAAEQGIKNLELAVATVKKYLSEIGNFQLSDMYGTEYEISVQGSPYYPLGLSEISRRSRSDEEDDYQHQKEFEVLIAKLDAMVEKLRNEKVSKNLKSEKTEELDKPYFPFLLKDVNEDIKQFQLISQNLLAIYKTPKNKNLTDDSTEILNLRKMRQHVGLKRHFHNSAKKITDNLLGEFDKLLNGEYKTLQVIVSDPGPPEHQLLLHAQYDAQNKRLNLLCFDSAALVAQAKILDSLTYHLNKYSKEKEINVDITACQAAIQTDIYSCGFFTHCVANKLMKHPNIFADLKNAEAIVQPDFMDKNKSVNYKQLDNTKWIDISAFPDKIILTAQSFKFIEKALTRKYKKLLQAQFTDEEALNKAVNEKVTQIVTSFKQQHGLNNLNVYISQTRSKIAAHLNTDLQITFLEQEQKKLQEAYEAEMLEKIKHDIQLLTEFLTSTAGKLQEKGQKEKNKIAIEKAKNMLEIVGELKQCDSIDKLKSVTQRIMKIASELEIESKIFKGIISKAPTDFFKPESEKELIEKLKQTQLLKDFDVKLKK